MSRTRLAEPGRTGDLAALLAGGLLPLAFAPVNLVPLAWAAPALLFATWLNAAPRLAARRGFLFGLGLFGVGVSWVYVAIHDYGFTSAPVAAMLTAGFVALFALYPALNGYLAALLMRRMGGNGGEGGLAPRLLILLPALWVGVEWVRGWFLTGFPWLSLGYSQIGTPLAGYAPLFGLFGLSWLAALTAGALLHLWLRPRRAAPLLLLLLSLWGGGEWLSTLQWTRPAGEPLPVSLVQGNQPQITQWSPEGIERRLRAYADLSEPALGRSRLIVWPENAVTVFYQDLKEGYFAELETRARAAGSDLILGVPLLDEDGERYYTTMMTLGSSHAFYRKSHLVPFGEFVPLEGLLRGLIGFFDLPMSGFVPGPEGQGPLTVAGHPVAISICYEDAFGEAIIRALPEAHLLVNGSNNAWYGDSFAPHQHLQIARMRALESGRPLLRATTNGISALIDHRGRLLAASPQFETHLLNGTVQPMEGSTPYVRWGNLPVLALLALALAWVGFPALRSRS